MFLFFLGDTNNIPMVIGWVVCLVLALVLLRTLNSSRKWLIRLLTACLIVAVAFVFYASAADPKPASGNSAPPALEDTVLDRLHIAQA